MDIRPRSFQNKEGRAEIGGVSATALAESYGTPLYILDEDTLRYNCRQYTDTLKSLYPNHQVVYAGKANLNTGLLNVLNEEGLGCDVVSGGELATVLNSNIPTEKVIFHGNNKSIQELRAAIQHNVKIVVDNPTEAHRIMTLAKEEKKMAYVLIRIKPEIEAHTHKFIKTGQSDSKFGIEKSQLIPLIQQFKQADYVTFEGVHGHIGSQIFEINPYLEFTQTMVTLLKWIKDETGTECPILNLGGGIGIAYTDQDTPTEIPDYLTKMIQVLKESCQAHNIALPKLLLEPGRSIVGNAGVTLYSIGTIKDIPNIKTYIFIDGGMADNIRPLLYQSKYTFELANKLNQPKESQVSVAGKFCESGDILAENIALPTPEIDDLLIVYGTGAYNYSMSSNYNRACKPAMVLVHNGKSRILVEREGFEDILRKDKT